MDKPNKNKTITIKINHKEQPFKKIETKKDLPQSSKEEWESWNPFEKVAAKETAATEELKEEEFDWILPELNQDVDEYSWISPKKKLPSKKTKKRRKLSGPFIPISLIIGFAVLVGVSIGLFILKMVITDSTAQQVNTIPIEEGTSEEQPVEGKAYSITLSPLTTYLVQGGAFQTVEGALQEEGAMLAKGIPAKAITKGSTSYLFIGVTSNLENAKLLGTQLQAKGIETYVKEDSFGGTTLDNLTAGEHQLLTVFPEVYQLLTNFYSTLIKDGGISDTLPSLEGKWSEITGVEKEELKKLKGEIDETIFAMKQYEEAKGENLLNSIQQHLLNALAIYTQL